MSDYRVYPLRPGGRLAQPAVIAAATDELAMIKADALDCPLGYEIWDGARLVANVKREPLTFARSDRD